MIREILQSDDARLRERSVEVDWQEGAESLRALSADLCHTMKYGERPAIGLSAPQVGVFKRLFVMEETLDSGRVKVHLCINPEVVARRGIMRMREGCLSFGKDEYVETARSAEIELEYSDLNGRRSTRRFKGILAVCAQHELDHLDGKLMSDRGELKRRGESREA